MSYLPQGAGNGPAGPYNFLVAAPGQKIVLGTTGGALLLGPPGAAPGSMTLSDLQNRVWHLLYEDPAETGGIVLELQDLQNIVWHLLREQGPDTGQAAPTSGDYSQSVVTRDLNVAQAMFISETGITYTGSPIMSAQTDTPVVPPQYAMALVYRVLIDYWQRKSDPEQSKAYAERYATEVQRASRGQGNFTPAILTRDLNIALAQFIADTGIAPSLTDRMDTFSVFPVLDFPVPPGLVSLTRIEYTPSGQQTYVLLPKSMQEFDQITGGIVPNDQGQPYYYRQPWAGYVRLTPQPTIGNAMGPGLGTITVSGSPVAGNVITVTLTNPGSAPVVIVYTVQANDTLSTIAFNLSSRVNQSPAVTGAGAFLQPSSPVANTVTLTAILAPGTLITYQTAVTGSGVVVAPVASTQLSPNGDTITFYYSSLGTMLVYDNDVPGIPPQYHIALVYRVLADYWDRKKDPAQAKSYLAKYLAAVKMAKQYQFDLDRATMPTLGGDLDDNGYIIGGTY